jgi:hypothetical protein
MLKFIDDLTRPFHNKVVGILGIVAATLGVIANLRQYGVGAALLFLASSAAALFVLLSEIACVLSGKCHTTAMLNTVIAVGLFLGVIWYYGIVLFNGGANGLPAVKDQPISKVDRAVIPVSGLVEDEVKGLIQRRDMNRVE